MTHEHLKVILKGFFKMYLQRQNYINVFTTMCLHPNLKMAKFYTRACIHLSVTKTAEHESYQFTQKGNWKWLYSAHKTCEDVADSIPATSYQRRNKNGTSELSCLIRHLEANDSFRNEVPRDMFYSYKLFAQLFRQSTSHKTHGCETQDWLTLKI